MSERVAARCTPTPHHTVTIFMGNVKNTYQDVMKSTIVRGRVHEVKLKVIGAECYLGTGKFELIDLGSPAKRRKGPHLKEAA